MLWLKVGVNMFSQVWFRKLPVWKKKRSFHSMETSNRKVTLVITALNRWLVRYENQSELNQSRFFCKVSSSFRNIRKLHQLSVNNTRTFIRGLMPSHSAGWIESLRMRFITTCQDSLFLSEVVKWLIEALSIINKLLTYLKRTHTHSLTVALKTLLSVKVSQSTSSKSAASTKELSCVFFLLFSFLFPF